MTSRRHVKLVQPAPQRPGKDAATEPDAPRSLLAVLAGLTPIDDEFPAIDPLTLST